jgi:hypothetical protein
MASHTFLETENSYLTEALKPNHHDFHNSRANHQLRTTNRYECESAYTGMGEDTPIYIGSSENSNLLADEAKKTAMKYVMEERAKLKGIIDSIREYIVKNPDIIISDVNKIAEADENINLSTLLYCNNTLRHANNMTNWIFAQNKDVPYISTVQLRTIVEKEEFKIDYMAKTIVHLFSLAPYSPDKKQWNYAKAIKPVTIDGLPYMPPEIEIIDIYNQLITDGESKNTLQLESILYNKLNSKMGGLDEKKGGDLAEKKGGKTPTGIRKPCADTKREMVDIIKISTVQEWLAEQPDTIVLGSWGYNLWKLGSRELCLNPDRIQLISMRGADSIIASLTKHVRSIIGSNIQISKSDVHELNLPKEFRTQRTVLSIVIPSITGIKEKPFLELFNVADHTPTPAVKLENKYLVASKWVMCRFLFIDAWSMLLLKTYDKVDPGTYAERMSKTNKILESIKESYNEPTHIIGKYEEYAISRIIRTKAITKETRRFEPYIPYYSLKKNNKLRVI